jgi:hypothetical protein
VLDWLTNTDYAVWVRESWGWPFALTLHAFGNGTVIGLIFIISLRLLGLFRTIPYNTINKLIPVIWIAVVVQVYSGFSLFMTKPAKYLSDGLFQWKLILVIGGIVITLYLQSITRREAVGWDKAQTVTSSRAVMIGTITALVWAAVLVAGRLTAYLGQLYHA